MNLGEPEGRVRAYVAELGLTFPIVIDRTGEVARTYDVAFTPTHFLVDRAGVVRAAGSGSHDWSSPQAHAVVRVLLETAVSPEDRAGSPPPGKSGTR